MFTQAQGITYTTNYHASSTTNYHTCCKSCKEAKTKHVVDILALQTMPLALVAGSVIVLTTAFGVWSWRWSMHFFKQCSKKCQLHNLCNLLYSVNRSNTAAEEEEPAQNHINMLLEHNISSLCLTKIYYFLFILTLSNIYYKYSPFFPHFVQHEDNKVLHGSHHMKISDDFSSIKTSKQTKSQTVWELCWLL